jgi:hypothetical protein
MSTTHTLVTMEERMYRATGRRATWENTGGGCMALVWETNTGHVVVTEEGAARHEGDAWDSDDATGEAVETSDGATFATLVTAARWVTGYVETIDSNCEVCGAPAVDTITDVNGNSVPVDVCAFHEYRSDFLFDGVDGE